MNEMKFNPQQLQAINSKSKSILCLAAAGCGKTATITGRIIKLVNDGADPATILALTFTNAGAFEMRQRYKKLQGNRLTNRMPEFRTFHSFCYNIIIHNADVRSKLGYAKIPSVCNESEFTRLKKEVLEKSGIKLTEAQLKSNEIFNKEDKRQLEIFNKMLKKEMRERNLITFDMMCYNVGELFVSNDNSIVRYKNFYKHILCDEFQDTDPRQFKFLNSFGDNVTYFCVGDALQCIYQFRNCTNEYVKLLSEASNIEVVKMYKNYRSTRQICEFANKFSKYAKDSYRIEMEGQRDGDEVEIIRGACASFGRSVDKDHLELLAKKIKSDPVETAVLCRTNKEVKEITDYLRSEGLECSRSSKESESKYLLNSALDNNYMKEWLSTLLEGERYADYIRLSALNESSADIRWFLSLYGNDKKIQDKVAKVIKIRKLVSDKNSTVEDKLKNILKLLKIKLSEELTIDDNITSRQLIETLRNKVLEDEETKLYVGTIHSSKGLEYEHVYVMGVNDKSFQLGSEEMNNLYYVAITRARDRLTVFRR